MDETSQVKKNAPIGLMAGVVALIAAGILGFMIINKDQKKPEDVQMTPTAPQEAQIEPTVSENTSVYKNGTYSVIGNYTSPGGAEELGVTVTLTDGFIRDVVVEPKATRPISKVRQADFAANYQPQVIGKNIDEVVLGKVSGSSLSTKGFNDAIEKIKAEARS